MLCKCTSTEVCSLVSSLFPLQALSGELSPFLCSGSHQAQRDCQPSALNCFVEAMSQCVPPIPIRPCVLKYLGKTHNLWLRSTLMLEQQAFEKGLSLHSKPKQSTEFYEQESITPPQQVLYWDFSSQKATCNYWFESHSKFQYICSLIRRFWTLLRSYILCSKRRTCGQAYGRNGASFQRPPQPLPMSSMASLNR